jgi:osmotically-inducible protein OsmY
MARANQNNLKGSSRQSERQQRDEQPEVAGASGAPEDAGRERRSADRREEQGASGRRAGTERRRRPDETLAREIREILTSDPELDATAIEVEVEDGAVTVLGEVADPQARLLAEELVESVAGVRGVQNRLRVVG